MSLANLIIKNELEPDVDTKHNLLVNHAKTVAAISNFDYLPVYFRGLHTRSLGLVEGGTAKEDMPFFKLKNIAINKNETFEDRLQAVRYMCYVPHIEQQQHLIECCTDIITNESYDPYQRYFFFSNNQKNFKLEGNLVHELFGIFFRHSITVKGFPFELSLMAARYILGQYDRTSELRFDALDWVADIASDETQNERTRADAADALITCGEWDEMAYGHSIIKEIGKHADFSNNSENVHTVSLTDSARNVIRALVTSKLPDSSFDELSFELLRVAKNEDKDKIEEYIRRLLMDPTKYDNLTIKDIALLVWKKCLTLSPDQLEESKKRFIEEALDSIGTCTSGYMMRSLNVLQGFIIEKEFELKLSFKDEIRNIVFAKLNTCLVEDCSNFQRDIIIESMMGEDKMAAQEFVMINDPTEKIWIDYSNHMPRDEFDSILKECLNQYIGIV